MPPLDDKQPSEYPNLEEMRVQLEQLRSFQNTIYDFLHEFCNYDIKQPLLTVNGYAELMTTIGSLTPLQQELYLTTIRLNGEKILKSVSIPIMKKKIGTKTP